MEKTRLALLLGGTLAVGLALGAGGVYLVGMPGPVPARPTPAPAAAPLVPPPAPSQPELPPPGDAERALKGVQRGEFLSLEAVSNEVRTRFSGEILGVKLSEDDGVTFYEFKILTKNGRVVEVEVDPKTGNTIDVDEDDD